MLNGSGVGVAAGVGDGFDGAELPDAVAEGVLAAEVAGLLLDAFALVLAAGVFEELD